MTGYFTRERFGRPQFLAGMLLACFLAQAVWLVRTELRAGEAPDGLESVRIREGWRQWTGHGVAGAPFLEGGFGEEEEIKGTSGRAGEIPTSRKRSETLRLRSRQAWGTRHALDLEGLNRDDPSSDDRAAGKRARAPAPHLGAPHSAAPRTSSELSFENSPGGVRRFDSEHSPLLYLATAGPLLLWP